MNNSTINTEWAKHLVNAFGSNGVICTAFYLGTLLAEDIRTEHQTFPFLEITGESGTGKSTLIEFLNKLVGLPDWEGINPNMATVAGRSRYFCQEKNLPIVLIEPFSDSDKKKRYQINPFDWNDVLMAYNGHPITLRALKLSNTETLHPKFRGSIIISQREKTPKNGAITSRMISVDLSSFKHTADGCRSANWLSKASAKSLSGFLKMVEANEGAILNVFNASFDKYKYILQLEKIPHRTAQNYGQIMALILCLEQLKIISGDVSTSTQLAVMNLAKTHL